MLIERRTKKLKKLGFSAQSPQVNHKFLFLTRAISLSLSCQARCNVPT